MTGPLHDQTVLVIGRGSGIARAITIAARDAGARSSPPAATSDGLADAYAGEPDITTETVDLTDEASIAALGERLGTVDHVVSTASARARGRLADLDRDAVRRSFDTKVIGPLMLAKHLAPRMRRRRIDHALLGRRRLQDRGRHHGRGHHQRRRRRPGPLARPGTGPDPGQRHLPGRDRHRRLGRLRRSRPKRTYFDDIRAPQPRPAHRHHGDIADGVLFAMTSPFLTGTTLHIDGGEPLT